MESFFHEISAKDLRQKISSTDRELSSLQLQVPALENERSALLSEMDAVDKQLEEEQSRFDTLMSKFKTFHAQLIESGIASLMTVNFSGVESRQDEDIPDVLLNDYSALSSIQINAAESWDIVYLPIHYDEQLFIIIWKWMKHFNDGVNVYINLFLRHLAVNVICTV